MSQSILEVFPYLRVRNCAAAIEFYRQAFGAQEKFRLMEPGGRIGHAELTLGPVTLMLSDEYPEYGISGPETIGGTGSSIHLHVPNCDAAVQQAAAAGASVTMPPTDMFYGERAARIRDPFGHEWLIGSQIEVVSPEEMQRRFDAMCQGEAGQA